MTGRNLFCVPLLVALIAGLSACTWMGLESEEAGRRQGVSSSLVDYLYPGGETPPEPGGPVPRLTLPVRVGIAFVPPASARDGHLDEATKQDLLELVSERFSSRDYIASIETIPGQYMAAGTGFENLDRIARLYGLEVMALVSYDQTTFTGDTKASFWYWTIVGAYVVKGSRNDVSTFVDTAVFHLPSRELIMRAPGTSHVASKATMAEIGEELRDNQTEGFELAMADMTGNLEVELNGFEARVEAGEKTPVRVVDTRAGGSSGGGGSGGTGSWMAFGLAAAAWTRSRIRALR